MTPMTNPGATVQCGLRDRSNWRRNSSAVMALESMDGTVFPDSPLMIANKSSSVAARISSSDISAQSISGISMSNDGTRGGSMSHMAELPFMSEAESSFPTHGWSRHVSISERAHNVHLGLFVVAALVVFGGRITGLI